MSSGRKPVIVDAGANIGAASIWFRKKYPGAAIVAVEPDPRNLRVLRLNVEGRQEIAVVPAAIGSREGLVRIEDHGQGWSTRTKRDEGGVPVITMANAFARVRDGIPFIAKIDIEGFESDLFADNTEWLNEVYMVAIEPHDWLLPGERTSRAFQVASIFPLPNGPGNFDNYTSTANREVKDNAFTARVDHKAGVAG